MGMSVYFDTIKNTHVEVSYGRKYEIRTLVRAKTSAWIFPPPPMGWSIFTAG